MRIVFLGTPDVAVPAFEALRAAGHDLPLVLTRPDRPVGRSRRPEPPPVKRAALAAGCELLQPRRIRDPALRERIGAVRPDLLVVVAYGRILDAPLLALPRLGPVNLHFSLLPAYRGAAPVQWSLVRGETVTGVTTMRMNERLDEGDVLEQRSVPIEPGEHAPALAARLAAVGAELLVETVDGLGRGAIASRPQEHAAATFAPILTKADGNADPALRAEELAGRVRGFDPWPGVWLMCRGRRLRIAEARCEPGPPHDAPAGTLLAADRGLVMVCGGGSGLRLLRVQPEGSRVLSVGDALNGRRLAPGDRLDAPPAG